MRKRNEEERKESEKELKVLEEIKESKNITYIIAFLFLVLCFVIPFDYIFDLMGIKVTSNGAMIFNCVFYVIMFIITFIPMRKMILRDFKELRKNFLLHLDKAIGAFIIMLISTIAFSSIVEIATGLTNNRDESFLENVNIVYLIGIVGIFAPIIEEFMCRGLLRRVIKNRYLYIIVSGVLFGCIHFIDGSSGASIIFIVDYILAGIVLAKTYTETNNIFTSIIAHMLNNLFSVIIGLTMIMIVL